MSQVLRKCNKCGFEAHTTKDLELFKTHSRYDPYLSSYPYGKDPICLKCYREYDKKYHKQAKLKDPTKSRKAVLDHFHKYPERHKAVAYANAHIETGSYCILCKGTENLQKHHPDYTRPDFVITLCASCHHKLHVNVRISSQNKKPLCDSCEFHPEIEGDFRCRHWNKHIAQNQKRKNYCKGYAQKKEQQQPEQTGTYYCAKIKRTLTVDELLRLNCLHSQKRHWGTANHKLGPCPKISKVTQTLVTSASLRNKEM